MKHAKRFLAALLAGVLALAAFTGCSGLLNFATVQVNTEEAQALMKQVSPALQYDTQLEYAAERIAQWMTEEVTNLTTADGQLVRKVQLDPGTGNMNPGISVNEFISDSTNGSLYLSSNVKIALTMDNSGNPYYDPGRLYAPAAQDAVEALRSEAEGCTAGWARCSLNTAAGPMWWRCSCNKNKGSAPFRCAASGGSFSVRRKRTKWAKQYDLCIKCKNIQVKFLQLFS